MNAIVIEGRKCQVPGGPFVTVELLQDCARQGGTETSQSTDDLTRSELRGPSAATTAGASTSPSSSRPSSQGINKVSKLARAHAAERHLVIVLDPFSPAGMGIPLALTARHERAAADYGLPSFTPPEPLTHLWLLPAITAGERPFAGCVIADGQSLHDAPCTMVMKESP